MHLTEEELEKILEAGKFLLDKGYSIEQKKRIIRYSMEEKQISVYLGRFTDELGEVGIKFLDANKYYNLGWITHNRGVYRPQLNGRFDYLMYMLSYLREEYDNIINIDFCEESYNMKNMH